MSSRLITIKSRYRTNQIVNYVTLCRSICPETTTPILMKQLIEGQLVDVVQV